ncbi:MAG TPA: hypothetical protein PKD10_02065 [Paracoccaceae bacterium]|nr:hypothetical protein [Paracoccaceae bacterium]HMO71975.1 hypothetical protein [Paracoccaceae bacterium]
MTRHLADKRGPSDGGRVRNFLRIARDGGDKVWQGLWRKPQNKPAEGRRVVEYVRIAREAPVD